MIRPDFISRGDAVAVIAPSYHLSGEELSRAMEAVRSAGFRPVPSPNLERAFAGKYAGTPGERAEDLVWAYSNPEIGAVMPARGGYGTIQLLGILPADLFLRNPRWLLGYSDITTLHAAGVCSGVMGIHGIMGSSLASPERDALSEELTFALLCGKIPEYTWNPGGAGRYGSACGMLVGGNLATFTPLAGTPYDFLGCAGEDLVLFVEEVEESARNIDRMFNALRLHGALDRVRGIVLGDFTECGDEFGYGSTERMLLSFTLSGLDIPVACGFPAGHAGRNWPLVEGARVRLDVAPGSASLSFIDL
ncbi:MAG TPA: LD-carboxypeptidase [Candidatus Cryptobacteroides pullicola]|nr:LD-carboxypeptidase [Candidatus Cryptobacteroides pullicola]